MSRVWQDFLRRQPLPAENCRTAFGLLEQLKRGCQPFRFLDLPRELRDRVCELCFDGPYRRNRDFHHRLPGVTSRVMALKMTPDTWYRTKNPSLLSVNHQVRAEIGKLYYEQKQFDIFVDLNRSAPLEEIDLWSKRVVREFAPHLRDAYVYITSNVHYFHLETTLHVQLPKRQGLRATGSHGSFCVETQSYEDEPEPLSGLPVYVDALETKRRESGQRGEAIIDFFLADQTELRRACFGYTMKLAKETDGYGGWRDCWVECDPNDPDAEVCSEW